MKKFIILTAVVLQSCALMDDQKSVQPYEEPQKKYVSNPVEYRADKSIPDENSEVIENPLKADRETIEAGKVLYRKYCHHCHGVKYDGNGPVGESIMKKPPDLRSALVQDQTDRELFLTLSNGKGLSPSLKHQMSAKERWQVLTFMRTLK